MEPFIRKKKKKKQAFWFENNQDAQGYYPGDNRTVDLKRVNVRRTFNI